ncbi:MAG: hypothetical protein MUO60_12315 [Clostridiaceae bacterium]|nr:hypothetical protein [Clostridiaceae bacterium]
MDSKTRVIKALERKQPDRVPICEMFINKSIRKKICSKCSYMEFINKVDIDVAVVPWKKQMKNIGNDFYKDDWQVIYKDTGENGLIEVGFPISSKSDLLKYKPPNPQWDNRLKQLQEIVEVFKNEKAIIFSISDAFSRPRKLIGMENLLLNYISNPDFINELVNISLEYTYKLIEEANKIGVDIFVSGDDYADKNSSLMSPKHFEKFILQGLTKIVSKVHQVGSKYIKHTDGNINGIFEMLISSGIDGLHPIDPNAGMDILKIKKKYGEKICLIGNVNCITTLVEGSPESVKEEVKWLIDKIGPGGGFMIASSNSIHNGVKPENFLAMIEATKLYGGYS